MQWYLVFGSILTMAIAVFALQNPEQVTFKFLFWQLPSFPMVLVIFFSTALGALTSLLFSLAKQLKYNLEIRDLHGKIKTLQKKVAELEAPKNGQQTQSHNNN